MELASCHGLAPRILRWPLDFGEKICGPLVLKNIFYVCQDSNHHSAVILLTALSSVGRK